MGIRKTSNSADQSRMETEADRKKMIQKSLFLLEAEKGESTDGESSDGEGGEDDGGFEKGIDLGDDDTDEESSDDGNEYEEDSVVELVFEEESKPSVDEEPLRAMKMIKYGGPEISQKAIEYQVPRKEMEYEAPRKAIEYEVSRKAIEYVVSERSSDGSEVKQVYHHQSYKEYAGCLGEQGYDDSDSEKEYHGYPSEEDDGTDSE
ncbi:hypothetical protein HBI57_101280 [Parastagonospora nodorum]|nr:hypothetical protein HBI69_051160 [Parastagonospora nodorum]KAH6458152.1 hypothetical protein HBI57_101280 [Parastagonospora nodorum]KAH6491426.1 hypothetical protein HBI58_053160 [Parastagonospora nodorum]